MKYKFVVVLNIVLIFSIVFSLTLNEIREVSKKDPEKAFELLVKYLKSHPKDKEAQKLGKIIAAKRYLVKISPIADAVKKEDVRQLIRSMTSLTSVSVKTMDYIEVVFPDFYDTLRKMTTELDESAFRACSILPYRVREPKKFYRVVVDTYFASPLQFDPKRIEKLKCMNLSRIKSNIKSYLEDFIDNEDYYVKILNLSDMLLIEPPHGTDLRLYYDLSYKLTTINVSGLTSDDFKDLVSEYEKIHLKKSKLALKLKNIYLELSEKYDLSFCRDEDICPKVVVLSKKKEEKINEEEEKITCPSTLSTVKKFVGGENTATGVNVSEFSQVATGVSSVSSEASLLKVEGMSASINVAAKAKTKVENKLKTTVYVSVASLAGAMIVSLVVIRLKDPLKRIRKLKRKIAMNPTDPSLHFKLAELYEEIGRSEDAIKEYHLASKLFNEQKVSFENDQKEP